MPATPLQALVEKPPRLIAQRRDGWLLLNGLTTQFSCSGSLQGRIAPNKERQQRADDAADQREQEGIVHPHSQRVLAYTELERLSVLTHLLSATRSHIRDVNGCSLRQVRCENRYTNCPKDYFGRTH